MEFDLTVLGTWVIPLVIAGLQIYSSKQEKKKDAEHKKEAEKWSNVQKYLERLDTDRAVADKEHDKEIGRLEKELNRLEMKMTGEFLPRNEFADFLNNLDERLERDRIELEKHLTVSMEKALAQYALTAVRREEKA